MDVSNFEEFKNKIVDDVIDEIKARHPIVRINYPKMMLTQDYNPSRLNINCDVHGRILSFSEG